MLFGKLSKKSKKHMEFWWDAENSTVGITIKPSDTQGSYWHCAYHVCPCFWNEMEEGYLWVVIVLGRWIWTELGKIIVILAWPKRSQPCYASVLVWQTKQTSLHHFLQRCVSLALGLSVANCFLQDQRRSPSLFKNSPKYWQQLLFSHGHPSKY